VRSLTRPRAVGLGEEYEAFLKKGKEEIAEL
jgi:hypothetical protein